MMESPISKVEGLDVVIFLQWLLCDSIQLNLLNLGKGVIDIMM